MRWHDPGAITGVPSQWASAAETHPPAWTRCHITRLNVASFIPKVLAAESIGYIVAFPRSPATKTKTYSVHHARQRCPFPFHTQHATISFAPCASSSSPTFRFRPVLNCAKVAFASAPSTRSVAEISPSHGSGPRRHHTAHRVGSPPTLFGRPAAPARRPSIVSVNDWLHSPRPRGVSQCLSARAALRWKR